MRYARLLSLLLIVLFLPTTLAAAPRRTTRESRFVQVIKKFVIAVQTRITIPTGDEEPPAPAPPPGN